MFLFIFIDDSAKDLIIDVPADVDYRNRSLMTTIWDIYLIKVQFINSTNEYASTYGIIDFSG